MASAPLPSIVSVLAASIRYAPATAQPYVDAKRIAVMGMSNGGRTVLAALRTSLKHPDPFVAGIALYPGCQSDIDSRFYAPLLVLMGRADTVAPASYCEAIEGLPLILSSTPAPRIPSICGCPIAPSSA